ncbi:MAG: MopE-related protein [bacterium]
MKYKCFLKVIFFVISLFVILTLAFISTTEAQTYTTVAAEHNLDVESDYKFFSIKYLATAYFEIKFNIKAVRGTGTKDVEIILKAENDEGDYETEDNDTFIYYLGDDSYSTSMASYQTIGPNRDGDIKLPIFTALFAMAVFDDPYSDWIDYTWTGSKIEKITVSLIADLTSKMDILKIKEYKFKTTHDDNDLDDSQDFSDYENLSFADWNSLSGISAVDTVDGTLYLRSSYLAQYEACCAGTQEICDGKDTDCDGIIPADETDKDGDGFMICEGDCDDSDDTIYPEAPGTYERKDNNCNGIIDRNEKGRFSYSLDARIFPLWMQSQQLGIVPVLPPYFEYSAIQKQMWYPYQLTISQQQSVKTTPYFFHPAPFTWLLTVNYYPYNYSPFMPSSMGAQYDMNFNQYLNSIIYNPFVFEFHTDNQTTQTTALLFIEIEASDTLLTIYKNYNDFCGTFRETVHLTYTPATSNKTAQLTVTGYYSDGRTIDLTNDTCTIYVSSNQDIVQVNNDGKVTAVGEGEATITVINSGISDQIIIKVEYDFPNNIIKNWAGTWEAWLTDPNEGVVTDPNGQIQIIMSGDIHFHITDQSSNGGVVEGTIKISGWDVDPQPEDWPGDWTGESDEVELTGWFDQATKYLKARYFYYPGKETSGDYAVNEDPQNIKAIYTWLFNSNKLTITDTTISGQLSITSTDGYYKIGIFSLEREILQY